MKTWPYRLFLAVLLTGIAAGCSGGKDRAKDKDKDKGDKDAFRSPTAQMANKEEAESRTADDNAKPKPNQVDGKAIERKIIYSATLKLLVDDYAKAEEAFLRLIEEWKGEKGNIESADISARSGSPRSGHWRVRLPPENLAGFRKAAARLGEADKDTLESQEVTEEFYSLIEDVKNKEEELKSYRRMFDQAKTIPDSVAVTKELERVRHELERMKSRQKVLDNLTSLTKVDVWIYERGAYIPVETPDFSSRSSRTFAGSLNALIQFGQTLALIAIALAPWLAVILLLAAPFAILWRRARRAALAAIPVLETPAPPAEQK
jgi:hypothetical protein